MEVWKICFISERVICRFHVNLPGCIVEDVSFVTDPRFSYGSSWGMGANLVMNSPGDPADGCFVHSIYFPQNLGKMNAPIFRRIFFQMG